MRRYIAHIQTKEPHARRMHAMQLATAVTLVVFVGWVATLGVRFGGGEVEVADQGYPSQAATPTALQQAEADLQVSQTSIFQ